ncbi:SIMPL domain-containing protein [Zemynaea arenosa]|nr:SIMPL domain-containing protein [Massilia arenosa]
MKTRIAAALLTVSASLSQAAELPNYPFIHANGRAEISVASDEATLDFEIVASDANAETAAATVGTRAGEIKALAASIGIAADDVTIADPRRDVRKDGTGWDIKVGVRILVRDISVWAALVQPVLGMQNIEGLAVDFGSTQRHQLEMQLLADAVQDAKVHAEALAKGAGRKVGAVAGISYAPVKNLSTSMGFVESDFRYTRDRAPASAPRPASEYLAVQAVKLQQQVDVVYRIK